MGIKVRVVLESDDFEPDRYRGRCVQVGTGELDSWGSGLNHARIIPGLPELLRQIAEQLESAMTTGPDETTWLGTPDAPDEVIP